MTGQAPKNGDLVVVALSGGVDSATACAMLVEAGHRVVGMTLRLYDARGTSASAGGRCCGPRDIEDARRVCAHLDIPFYVVNHEAGFDEAVIDDFVAEYVRGRTPNPCVRCNERVKFAPLLERARALGAAWVATGHYARIEDDGERRRLFRGRDPQKDQSYFLFAVPPDQLDRVVFPLGGLAKEEVRERARRYGLPNAAKAESQEICFVPDGDHVGFVTRRAGAAAPGPGEIVDEAGTVLAEHPGVHHFTIGQRRGLGRSLGDGEPRYVVSVDALTRRVVVGPRASTEQAEVRVDDVRWLSPRPDAPIHAEVQVRHRHKARSARVVAEGASALVTFDEPQQAVAPGQAAVFYRGDEVLGGGWIA